MAIFFNKKEVVLVGEQAGFFRKVKFVNDDDNRSFHVPAKDLTERTKKKSLTERHREQGFVEYYNSEARERIPYNPTRDLDAHNFLLDFVSKSFAAQDARVEVHAPTGHPTIVSELASVAGIAPDEAEKRIIWGVGGAKGDAHSVTYNLHIPNPNKVGLDDDLVVNLNHRHGLSYVQIGKQDLVKMLIGLGFLPERRR